MAVDIKDSKRFRAVVIFSALIISGMAAVFSVTGIATLFSGYFGYAALMMGALEFGKIIVASLLARFWNKISWILRTYFMIAVFALIGITSAGIFGFLSDAYQSTKGDYTIVEKQVKILNSKKQVFIDRKARLENDKETELKSKESNQIRADSLTARGQSINRTRDDIKESENKISNLETQITAAEDSIGVYDLKIIDLEAKNISGELGPLKYIADAFGTDMDTAVKYLIFILIFVFDPLAILLFVASNILIRQMKEEDWDDEPDPSPKKKIVKKIENEKIDITPEKTKEPDLFSEPKEPDRNEEDVGESFFVKRGYSGQENSEQLELNFESKKDDGEKTPSSDSLKRKKILDEIFEESKREKESKIKINNEIGYITNPEINLEQDDFNEYNPNIHVEDIGKEMNTKITFEETELPIYNPQINISDIGTEIHPEIEIEGDIGEEMKDIQKEEIKEESKKEDSKEEDEIIWASSNYRGRKKKPGDGNIKNYW